MVAVTALVTACAAQPGASSAPEPASTPTPAVTASPTATPSPTPVADVSKLFAAHMVNPQFKGAGAISGTMTIGNLEGKIAGAMQMEGEDSAFEMAIEIPNVLDSSSASIKVGGIEYTSRDGGPWFRSEDAGTDEGLAGAIGVAALTASDDGVVTWQGQRLHHMVPGNAGTITAADLGMTEPSMANAATTLDFYARDDGSLAGMSITIEWTVDSGGTQVPAAMAMDFSFDENPTVAITAPTDIWAKFTSKQHAYTIGYPADMQLVAGETAEDPDVFGYSSSEYAIGLREGQPKAAKDDLDAYVRAFLKATPNKPEISEATEVAGETAWRVAYHDTVDGEKLYLVFTLLIEGRDAYMVAFVGPTGFESDIVAFHEMQLATLEIPGR